ncbi:MAG: DUF4870 domain-containing protein [Lysobacterales bacterium]
MNETIDAATSAPTAAFSAEERNWAMAAHLASLVLALLTSWFFGVGGAVGALAIWLIKRDDSVFVAEHAKEALNFNVTMALIALLLIGLTLFTLGLGLIVTVPAAIVIGIAWFVCTIIAAMRAKEGLPYRYPFALRLF